MRTIYSAIIRTVLVSGVLIGLLIHGGITPAAAQVLPPIITPSPGSTLITTTVEFTGGHASQAGEEHYLTVGYGTGAFDNNITHEFLGTGHTATVSGLPTSGTLHVLYWTKTNAASWAFRSHTYTMAVGSSGGGSGGGEAAHTALANDHGNLATDHDDLDQKLDQVLADSEDNHTLRWDKILDSTNGDAQGCNSDRFKCIFGGAAVLDLETGLVWERSPVTTTYSMRSSDQNVAFRECLNRGVGGKSGWRLPTIPELASLLVPGDPAGGPDLPVGHPFSNIQSAAYWSVNTARYAISFVFAADFSNGNVFDDSFDNLNHVWCVRGPGQGSYD